MRTLVFQSSRPTGGPAWLEACVASVRDWAGRSGFAYRRLGDELLEPVPGWLRERCAGRIWPVTDIGRMLWAKAFLTEGWDRVVWADADIAVFDPEGFRLDPAWEFALCREIWVTPRRTVPLKTWTRVNNCIVCVTAAGASWIDAYLAKAFKAIESDTGDGYGLEVGTTLFTQWRESEPFDLVTDVATVNPGLIHDLATGGTDFLRAHASAADSPVHAAHLVQSFGQRGRHPDFTVPEDFFARAVARLLDTAGTALAS